MLLCYYCYKLIVHFKMAMAGNGAEVGAGAKISKKVKPEQKINNFGSATQLINFCIYRIKIKMRVYDVYKNSK